MSSIHASARPRTGPPPAQPAPARISDHALGRLGFGWAVSYLPIHIYWALGGTITAIGMTGAQDHWREANWGASLIIAGAGLTCLSLTREWGRVIPRGLRVGAAWVGGLFAVAHWLAFTTAIALQLSGVVGYAADPDRTVEQLRAFGWANIVYFEPWFGLMGVLLIAAARRARTEPRTRRPGPIDRVGVAVLVAGLAAVIWGVFRFDPWIFAVGGPAAMGVGLLTLVIAGRSAR